MVKEKASGRDRWKDTAGKTDRSRHYPSQKSPALTTAQ